MFRLFIKAVRKERGGYERGREGPFVAKDRVGGKEAEEGSAGRQVSLRRAREIELAADSPPQPVERRRLGGGFSAQADQLRTLEAVRVQLKESEALVATPRNESPRFSTAWSSAFFLLNHEHRQLSSSLSRTPPPNLTPSHPSPSFPGPPALPSFSASPKAFACAASP